MWYLFHSAKFCGMFTPAGHGIQYRQPVQPFCTLLCKSDTISEIIFSSASSSGLKFEKVFRLSSTCSSFDIPLRITFTLEWLPTQRNAQDAMLASLSIALNFALISSEKFARLPPFTGSMITSGIPSSSAKA